MSNYFYLYLNLPDDDAGYVYYGQGGNWQPSDCVWMVPGTWKED